MAAMPSKALLVVLFSLAWVDVPAQEGAGMGLELVGLGLDIADMIISAQDHEEVMDKLAEIQHELDEIKQELDEIEKLVTEVLVDVKNLDVTVTLQALDDAHVAVTTAFSQLQLNKGSDSQMSVLNKMAATILDVDGDLMKARENYYEALMGTLPSLQGKTLIETVFKQTKLLPVHLMQGVGRTMSINQALISWAYMQTGQLDIRQQDKAAWMMKSDAAWDKNRKAVFAIAQCKWSTDHSMTLSCDTNSLKLANVTVGAGKALHTSCPVEGDNAISIPTRGSDHDDWSFDVQCEHAATGIQGGSNVPHGHGVSYVAGFKLHCKSGGDTDYTAHFLHDGDEAGWDVDFHGEPLKSVTGCVTKPDGHEITYWASAQFTGVAGAKGSIVTKQNPCDSDSESYSISCNDGYCMKRFQGVSDVPNGHTISYIACMNIYCGICTDLDKDVKPAVVIV